MLQKEKEAIDEIGWTSFLTKLFCVGGLEFVAPLRTPILVHQRYRTVSMIRKAALSYSVRRDGSILISKEYTCIMSLIRDSCCQ